MNILLTGATGFLGKQLLHLFVQQGHQVIISCREHSKLSLYSVDILNQISIWYLNELNVDDMIKSHSKIDVIVHAATDYGRQQSVPTKVFWANEVFPMTLLEMAIQHKIHTFINIDTFFNSKNLDYQYLGAYSLSKRHFQEWAEYCGLQGKINVVNLKLFHMFGPNDDIKKYVPMMISRCLNGDTIDHTDGEQKRDFIYSEDVVDAVNAIINADLPCGYHHYDVGRGEAIRLRDFSELINRLCGVQAKLNFGARLTRPGEPMHACAEIAPLLSLGWIPKISLHTGLSNIIEEQRTRAY